MKLSLVYLLTGITSSLCFAQRDSLQIMAKQDTLQLPLKLAEYTEKVSNLEKQQRSLDSTYKSQSVGYKEALDAATSSTTKIKLLDERTKALEEYNERREAFYRLQVTQRFDAGRDALNDMVNGVVIIGFMQDILNLQQDIDLTTNLWSDSSFGNTWDEIQRFGSGIGLITASAALVADKNQSNAVVTAGVSIAGLSSMLGILLGEDKSDKLREKAEFIDLTRRAYDDLNTRYFLVKSYVSANDSFEIRLRVFKDLYSKPKQTLADSQQAIAQVKLFYQEYEQVLEQIPNLLGEFESMQKEYIMKNPRMKAIFDDILVRITRVKNKYNEKVLPILDLSAAIKKILGT